MTSRRISGHKNYYEVLKRHQRASYGKRLIRLVIYIIIFLALMVFAYHALQKLRHQSSPAPMDQTSLNIDNYIPAGCFTYLLPNTRNYGKT